MNKCTEKHISCFNCERWNKDCPEDDGPQGQGDYESPFDEDEGLYA